MVITDIRLPDGDGIEILRHVKSASPETAVVVMTAYGTTETAVAAMKLGAIDYITKPFDIEELRIIVRGGLEKRRLLDENRQLKAELRKRHGLDRLVGVSAAMAALFELVQSVAGTTSTILITGESGTGKELVARAVHGLSSRRDAAFVSVNCGALPDTLLESELFGHVKGAFTDAHQTKKGLFEAAHKGTLFLDEVGETSPAMQVKLLRAIQERRIRRVGSTEETEVDVRVISATNVPLETLVKEKKFREDLFYRLQVIPIHVPPLRERRDDIPLLADHFVERFAREMGKSITRISEEAMDRLVRHHWPGNVRELENLMERAVALETSAVILPERLPSTLGGGLVGERAELGKDFRLDEYLDGLEAGFLGDALHRAGGDRQEAARLLGIKPRALRYLIQKHAPASS